MLSALFNPRSIAVIGASNDPKKVGHAVLQNLIQYRYQGRLIPVNPNCPEILGLKTVPKASALGERIDLAVIAVPARFVPDTLIDCSAAGVTAAVILSAGFKEAGAEGTRLEQTVRDIARERGIRILGPNCFGIYCPESRITILPGQNFSRETGPVGFLSQSGGLCADLGQIAKGLGIRFSKMVSYGNGCDVAACDLLEYFFFDEKTRIIAGYLEGVDDGRRFLKLLTENKGKKPVILWKAGLTAAGNRAVTSHTGSMGGGETLWNSALRQGGVIQVNSSEELVDTIYAFLYLPAFVGPRVSVMGGGGAISVAASDSLERLGLSVPLFAQPILQRLKNSFPPVGNSLRNPVDLGNPMIPPSLLRKAMEAAAEDEGIDTLVVIQILYYILFQVRHRLRMEDQPLSQFSFQPELLKACQEVREKYKKPILMVLPDIATDGGMIDLEREWRRERDAYQAAGFPVFKTIDRAARALSRFISFQKIRSETTESTKEIRDQ